MVKTIPINYSPNIYDVSDFIPMKDDIKQCYIDIESRSLICSMEEIISDDAFYSRLSFDNDDTIRIKSSIDIKCSCTVPISK